METLLVSGCVFLSLVIIGPSLSILVIVAYLYHLSRGTYLFASKGLQFPRVLLLFLFLNLPYQLVWMVHGKLPLNEWIGLFIYSTLQKIMIMILSE